VAVKYARGISPQSSGLRSAASDFEDQAVKKMAIRGGRKGSVTIPPWLTKDGIDMSIFPIDRVLKQALSPDVEIFRSACALLNSMCGVGRVEAGIFLLGLLKHYSDDCARLAVIADSLAAFPHRSTVEAFANEIRRVRGSSSTRAYLRQIIEALGRFPAELAEKQIQSLSSDPLVGARFRQHLRALLQRIDWESDLE
jgi:hypothetical protein